jgi:hypothetical protein
MGGRVAVDAGLVGLSGSTYIGVILTAMTAERRSDQAAVWVRKVAPDDDYLPPVEPSTPKWQVCGHLDDDEGVGPEAVYWAEKSVRPEQRRSRQRSWRIGQRLRVKAGNGKYRLVEVTWTSEDYEEPGAPPAGARPEQTPVPRRRPKKSECVEQSVVDLDDWGDAVEPQIDESLLTSDDLEAEPVLLRPLRPRGHRGWTFTELRQWRIKLDASAEPDDEYERLADPYFDYYGDDRPEWERQLESAGKADDELADDSWQTGDVDGFDDDDADNLELADRDPAGSTCENPNGCEGALKAKRRCGPCLEYRRTHHGEERPLRLINRARRRDSAA